jgi:hypothetical protein
MRKKILTEVGREIIGFAVLMVAIVAVMVAFMICF